MVYRDKYDVETIRGFIHERGLDDSNVKIRIIRAHAGVDYVQVTIRGTNDEKAFVELQVDELERFVSFFEKALKLLKEDE